MEVHLSPTIHLFRATDFPVGPQSSVVILCNKPRDSGVLTQDRRVGDLTNTGALVHTSAPDTILLII